MAFRHVQYQDSNNMKKNDKKKDQQISEALNDVCDQAQIDFIGFEWLTHTVNYGAFPRSLKITCVFDTNLNLKVFLGSPAVAQLNQQLKQALAAVEAPIQDTGRQIKYDTEENCQLDNAGRWGERLSTSC